MDRRNFLKRIAGGLVAIPLLGGKVKGSGKENDIVDIDVKSSEIHPDSIVRQTVTCSDHEWLAFHTTFENGTILTHTINLKELNNEL